MTDSLRLSTRAVAASAVALLVAGPAAGSAFADGDAKGGKGGRSAEHRKDAAARASGGSATSGSGDSATARGQRGPRVAGQAGGATDDPAGNNGTFKVDGLPFDDGLGNEPHVTCGFRLKMYGFDEGQTGDITITGQAPSGSGVVSERTGVLLSSDAAGGGPNDVDEVVTYTLDDLDLSGLTAHPQQGYHVKVTLSTDTPGGVKHKVFWIEPCATDVSGTDTTVGGTDDEVETPPAVLGTKFTRDTPPAAVLGTTVTRGPLAFTGSFAGVLLALGGGLVAAGGALVLWTRRSEQVR